jgi:hypothetical protein
MRRAQFPQGLPQFLPPQVRKSLDSGIRRFTVGNAENAHLPTARGPRSYQPARSEDFIVGVRRDDEQGPFCGRPGGTSREHRRPMLIRHRRPDRGFGVPREQSGLHGVPHDAAHWRRESVGRRFGTRLSVPVLFSCRKNVRRNPLAKLKARVCRRRISNPAAAAASAATRWRLRCCRYR